MSHPFIIKENVPYNMAQCPNCDKKIGILIKTNCKRCGTKYCNDCGNNYGSGIAERTVNDNEGKPHLEHWVPKQTLCVRCTKAMELRLVAEAMGSNPFGACPACGYDTSPTKFWLGMEGAAFKFPGQPTTYSNMLCLKAFCPKCSKTYSKQFYWAGGAKCDTVSNWNDEKWYNYSQARLAESVERIDDAANHYEKAGLLEKSRQLRLKNKNQVVHHITIDVNKMLEFLKDSNFTIPYKCPSCNGTIKLNGQRDASSFFVCEYCGTSLQAIDVQNMIGAMM